MTRSAAPVLLGALGVGAVAVALVAAASPARAAVRRVVDGRVGRYYTWAELSASDAAKRLGVDNTPPPEARANLEVLVRYVLDPLRWALGVPVRITSGYRTPAVNEAVGGSPTSQHMLGEAADVMVRGYTAEQLATVVVRLGLPFDQLIWYDLERGGHVHVSLTTRRPNRGETLHAPAASGYLPWRPP